MRFLFIDRVLQLVPGSEAVVAKNVSNSEDFFTDHFAGRPVMPGCLILETCDQAARLLLGVTDDFRRLPRLAAVQNAKLQHFVQPGDRLEVRVTLVSRTDEGNEIRAVACVGDRTVARVGLTYHWEAADDDPAAVRACARMREFYRTLTTDLASLARTYGSGTTQEGGRA
jgi:3-hydroxyacyl-[acyl-carrier-protein] dehydratase